MWLTCVPRCQMSSSSYRRLQDERRVAGTAADAARTVSATTAAADGVDLTCRDDDVLCDVINTQVG